MSLAIKEYSLKRQQDSFAIGMADRIGERLREMYDKQEAWIREHGGEATMALVVVKKQEVDAEYHKQFPRLGKGKMLNIADPAAFHNGKAHGSKIGLNMPISRTGGATRKQIG